MSKYTWHEEREQNSNLFVWSGPKHFYIFNSLKRMWVILCVISKIIKAEFYRVLPKIRVRI